MKARFTMFFCHNAEVFLWPSDGSKWNAGGTTDANGVAALYTHGMYKGITEGTYKLSIKKTILETIRKNSSASASEDESSTIDNFYTLVDLKYTDMQNTPLEIKVTPKKEDLFDLGPAVREIIPNDPE